MFSAWNLGLGNCKSTGVLYQHFLKATSSFCIQAKAYN